MMSTPSTRSSLGKLTLLAASVTLSAAALLTSPVSLAAGRAAPSPALTQDRVPADVYSALEREPDGSVFLYLKARADLRQAEALERREEKSRFVLDRLQETARTSQANLIALLKARGIRHESYYVLNAVQVWATPAQVRELGNRADVERVHFNYSFHMMQQPAAAVSADLQAAVNQASTPQATHTVEWHLTNIKAPQVWAAGIKGKGIVVAGNDTGANATHPSLAKHYRGLQSNGAIVHAYSWYDGTSKNRQDAPYDDHGHGTFTISEMVGDDGNGNQIGVAPEATWIACKNMNSAGVGTVESYTRCFQWLMAPTDSAGQNPRPDLAPHVVNNSWGCPPSEGCDKEGLHDQINTVQAAGVMLIFSAGNSGPGCSSVVDPPGTFPEVMSVGATDSSNTIASFSSRGPSAYDKGIKPDIAAPGANVRGASGSSSYTTMSGTSMAAPLVAGTVALLFQANPSLQGQLLETRQILTQSATDKKAPKCGGDSSLGVNNIYGYGLLNAKDAYDMALLP